ncbi:retrovirus-related pol polyprotein from transposon TNT 1-94 [Tanacetum coccineum]|uniref:Retrovirus-related pol polyprotein from transposon TNT 1-94 n=1 Tax=Tanacetum coccineum TaxID=301880 RepID=A0ABQ5CFH2_9ASTR
MQSLKGNKYCSNCRITRHTEEECWKVHLELFPKKWIKDDQSGKRTTATAQEELFTLHIQVKQELIKAIVDTGSQKNLIYAGLVQRLGLTTTSHHRPYSLGWIQKDMDIQVNKQSAYPKNDEKKWHDRQRVEGNFQEGDRHRTEVRLKTEGKKIKLIPYGPFQILKKIDKNVCQLKLPADMEMYQAINVEKLKLFKPSMLDEKPLQSFPSLDKNKKRCAAPLLREKGGVIWDSLEQVKARDKFKNVFEIDDKL